MKRIISTILAMALCLSLAASALAESGTEEIDYTTGTPWMDIDLEGNVTGRYAHRPEGQLRALGQ